MLNRWVRRMGKVSITLGGFLLWYESSFRIRFKSIQLFKPSFAENDLVNLKSEINTANAVDVVIKEKEPSEADDEEEWESKKEQCAFCRHFLLSPCSEPFKQWSRCVDKAKAEDKDFIETCTIQTKNLMECTSLNAQYFQSAFPTKDEAGDDFEDGEGSSDHATSSDRNIETLEKSDDKVNN